MINKTSRIIRKYLSGRFASETEEQVQKWLINENNQQEKEHASLTFWNELVSEADEEPYAALKRVNRRIAILNTRNDIPRKRLLKKRWRIAAVLIPFLLIAGTAIYFNWAENHTTKIFVAYGNNEHLFLPDGSEVWINSGSTIQYQTAFDGDKRIVSLDGEALFSVVKDQGRPFIVKTSRLSVNVLGTKFNLKAYADDENVITTLINGKVEVNTQTNETKVLEPGEQLVFNKKTSAINVTEIPDAEMGGWQTGELIFTAVTLDEIIKMLERRFDVIIENRIDVSQSKQYTIKFLKNENLTEILNILEDIVGFKYRQQANRIILTYK